MVDAPPAAVRVYLQVTSLVRVNRLTYFVRPIQPNGRPADRGLHDEYEVDAAIEAIENSDFSDFERRRSSGWWLAIKTRAGANPNFHADRLSTLSTYKVFTENAFRATGIELLAALRRWLEYGGFDPEGVASDGEYFARAFDTGDSGGGEDEYHILGIVDITRNTG